MTAQVSPLEAVSPTMTTRVASVSAVPLAPSPLDAHATAPLPSDVPPLIVAMTLAALAVRERFDARPRDER